VQQKQIKLREDSPIKLSQEKFMKVVNLIVRILLGLVFLVFGADKIVQFIPAQLPPGTAGQFLGILIASKYFVFVGLCEACAGLLLLSGRYIPLALVILGPVIVNILLTGLLLTRTALLPGIIVAILWFLVYWRVRSAFSGIFQQRVPA
jgi:putative oxidoreductase